MPPMGSGVYDGRDLINVSYHPLPSVLRNVNEEVLSLLRTSEEMNSEAGLK